MVVTPLERRVLAALEDGLPLVQFPYAALGARIGLSEADVIDTLQSLLGRGVIRRLGVIVRHRALGYRANAMVVWDVPDDDVTTTGRHLAELPFITLCYRRPRRPPVWPYNLFCMIHGRKRRQVERQIEAATLWAGLEARPRAILFSRRGFKQRGARFAPGNSSEAGIQRGAA